jgi:hypothetical protein
MSWLLSKAFIDHCENLPCLPGVAAGSLPRKSLDGKPSAPLNWMPTRRRFCVNDKMTNYSHPFLFGLTLRRLTATHGRALLRLYLADFPVRTLALPEKAPGSAASAPGCGESLPGLLARYDRATHSLKIPQTSLLGGSALCSVTLPRSGTMLNGRLYQRNRRAPDMSGNVSGLWRTPRNNTGRSMDKKHLSLCGQVLSQELWPTPCVPNGGRSIKHCDDIRKTTAYHKGKKVQVGLDTAVKLWPTLTCNDAKNNGSESQMKRDTLAINCVVHFPTPRAADHKGATSQNAYQKAKERGHRGNLPEYTAQLSGGGQLNAAWCEWLMGWPIGWTSLEPLNELRWLPLADDPADAGEIPRTITGQRNRANRIKCLGNGQVPHCAALAWEVVTNATP